MMILITPGRVVAPPFTTGPLSLAGSGNSSLTPIHNNNACREHQIVTLDGYDSWRPYQKPEQDLKEAGFDVLVFVPSIDEEDGLVTGGNAVLGGSTLKSDPSIIKIKGLLPPHP